MLPTDFTDPHGNVIQFPTDAGLEWRVAVYAIIFNDKKELLVTCAKHNDKYHVPGGGQKIGESIEEALARECAEETGYRITFDSSKPFFVAEKKFAHTSDKKFYHAIQLFYRAELTSNKPDPSLLHAETDHDAIEKIEWIPLEQLTTENVAIVSREVIKLLKG